MVRGREGGQAVRHGRQSQKSLWGSLSGRGVTLALGGDPPGFRVGDGTEAEEIGGHPEGGKGQPEPGLVDITTVAIIIIF